MEGWKSGWMMNGRVEGWMDDEWKGGWMMNGRVKEWMNE